MTDPRHRRELRWSHGASAVCALVLLAFAIAAQGSDACRRSPVAAAATVSVSDGSSFEVETWFAGVDDAAIAHLRDGSVTLNAVEGPFSWVGEEGDARAGTDFTRLFALGHQFHAWWLYFDELAQGAVVPIDGSFRGEAVTAREGAFPHGGTVQLFDGEMPGRPQGLRFRFPGDLEVEAWFDDWRDVDGRMLPWRVEIDDGERRFVYRYARIAFGEQAETWWGERPQAGWGTAQVGVYRLHRALLAAHCAGDAERLAALGAPTARYLGQGAFDVVTPEDIRARFEGVFERLDYRGYEDVEPPVIEVAASDDLAWATVQVRARGVVRAGGESFDERWAWVMMARRIEGAWRNAGIAASRR